MKYQATFYTAPDGRLIQYFRSDEMSFQDFLNLLLCTQAREVSKRGTVNRT